MPAGVVADAETTPFEIVTPVGVEERVNEYGPVPPLAVNCEEEAEPPCVIEILDPPATTTAVGVALTAVDESPEPAALIARNRTGYVVPFERPVITKGEVVAIGDRVVQVEPLLSEYS